MLYSYGNKVQWPKKEIITFDRKFHIEFRSVIYISQIQINNEQHHIFATGLTFHAGFLQIQVLPINYGDIDIYLFIFVFVIL